MVLYDYTDTDTDTDSVPWSVKMRHPVATHNNVHNERNVLLGRLGSYSYCTQGLCIVLQRTHDVHGSRNVVL